MAKASKECSPETADVALPVEVIAVPAPVAKVPGPFHPTNVVVEIVGTDAGDQGGSCEEHSKCEEIMAKDMVVHLWKVQIQVEGREEMAIAAYWVTEGIDHCRVHFLQHHMVRQAACCNGALAQVIRVLAMIQPAATPWSTTRFIK